MVSTYFPYDSWIYTGVLHFEILELVWGKWDTSPSTHFKLCEKEEPISNKLSNGILAESSVVLWKVCLTSSLPPPLHIISKMPRFLMNLPSGHVLLTLLFEGVFWNRVCYPGAQSHRHSFPWLPATSYGSAEAHYSQGTYHNTIVTKLVGEEVWVTS